MQDIRQQKYPETAVRKFRVSNFGFNVSNSINLSHSISILIFVPIFYALSIVDSSLIYYPSLTALMLICSLIYTILSYKFWSAKPFLLSAVATALIAAGIIINKILLSMFSTLGTIALYP